MSLAQTPINPNDVTINPEYEEMVPPLTEEEYTRLKDSIKEVGLYERIKINQDNIVLDGHHRLKACLEVGVMPRFEPKHFDLKLDEEIYVIESNVIRRQLKVYQKTVLGLKLEPMYAEKARQNMLAGVTLVPFGTRVRTDKEKNEAKSATKAARAVGLTPTTYHKSKTVIKEANPEELELFKKGKKTPSSIYIDITKRKKINTLEQNIGALSPLEGTFDTIVIDPPWEMGKYNQAAFRGGVTYPTMTLQEIQDINLPAKDDCVLWLWTTNTFLHEAYHVLDVWGFTPKSVLTWTKDKMGVGVWLRGQTEHCILAVKGKPIWQLKGQTTSLLAKNRGHSIKPDEFYDMVDTLCYGRKLDYFSRESREGWITYGTMEGSK